MVGRSGGFWRQVIMAGMFYSLEEAIEKLGKTEEEIKQIVADGKLREFRDGPSLLFKVEEVEALISDVGNAEVAEVEEPLGLKALEPEAPEAEAVELEPLEDDSPEPAASELQDLEPEAPADNLAEAELSDFDLPAAEDTAAGIPDLEALESEIAEAGTPEPEAPGPSESAADTDEILLAGETGVPEVSSDLTDADTAITDLGTNVLGETDADYDITDDTMAETAIPMGTASTGSEVPLEEIEEDLNLDSFGSGSGLLDLSLQADDTSLGGILDEIYTSEDEALEPIPAKADTGAPKEMVPEEEFIAPEMAAPAAALARPFIEAPPDAQSNTLGMLLFLPLLIVIYTTVVAVSGLRGVMPSILESIQGLIWFIMGGAGALALVVAAVAFLVVGDREPGAKKAKKPKKAKKAKKPKKVKEKKAKKAKKGK